MSNKFRSAVNGMSTKKSKSYITIVVTLVVIGFIAYFAGGLKKFLDKIFGNDPGDRAERELEIENKKQSVEAERKAQEIVSKGLDDMSKTAALSNSAAWRYLRDGQCADSAQTIFNCLNGLTNPIQGIASAMAMMSRDDWSVIKAKFGQRQIDYTWPRSDVYGSLLEHMRGGVSSQYSVTIQKESCIIWKNSRYLRNTEKLYWTMCSGKFVINEIFRLKGISDRI